MDCLFFQQEYFWLTLNDLVTPQNAQENMFLYASYKKGLSWVKPDQK